MKFKNNTIFFLGILLFVLLQSIVVHTGICKDIVTVSRFLELQLFVLYFLIVVYFSKKYGAVSLVTLFFLTLGLFFYMNIFLHLFGGPDYRHFDSLITITFDELVIQKMLVIYTIFMLACAFSYDACYKDHSKTGKSWEFEYSKKFTQIGAFLMLFFAFFAYYRIFIEYQYLHAEDFTKLYVGGSRVLPIPTYVRLFVLFFEVGYMFILAGKPSRRVFALYSFLFIGAQVPNLFLGYRATFATTLLFILWYWYACYGGKIKMRKLILILLPVVFLLQLVAYYRVNNEEKIPYSHMVINFLGSQSNSMNVLPLYIQYKDDMVNHRYPFVFDPFVAWLMPGGQSIEALQKRSSLGHQLVYSLNSGYYLSGKSLGTTNVAELYEFGITGVLLGGLLLGWFISLFDKNYRRKRIYLFYSMFIITAILISPRSYFFPYPYAFFRLSLIALFCLVIYLFVTYKLRTDEKTV